LADADAILERMDSPARGSLYVVATPIGNLDDLSARAVEVLKRVAAIACEDTRHTAKLLQRYAIDRPAISYHEHNERERAEELVARLEAGDDLALVSDAGTPLVSDPGFRLVDRAIAAGITVVPIPGASAMLVGLMAAGLATDEFRFCGFLPAKTGARKTRLEELKRETCTLVFFEAPHRILETLEDIEAVLGDRPVVAARELTKVHEQFHRGTAAAVREELSKLDAIRGEITLMVGKPAEVAVERPDDSGLAAEVAALEAAGSPRMDAIKQVARRYGLGKREVYQAIER
jgi:16S rRNA (cytidine1402-2'-O)-methyltransferase